MPPTKKTPPKSSGSPKKSSIPKKTTVKSSKKGNTPSGGSGKKLDYKKEFPDLYDPPQTIHEIEIPPMNFFMVDGQGNPNNNPVFQDAIGALYACSYGLKMGYKKQQPTKDYVVPPLEGLWYMDDMKEWSMANKEKWQWTLMIRIPDYIPPEEAQAVISAVKTKKNPPLIDQVRVESYIEGKTVQVLYLGAYDDELPTIQAMHQYAQDHGYRLNGKHHEIYLSDFRKVSPDKLRTVLRQPVSK
jgi:hypothetical protein